MKMIITVLALLAALSTGTAMGGEIVDCFYEANASHPACHK